MTNVKYLAIGVRLFAIALAVSAIKNSYYFIQAVIENFGGFNHWPSWFITSVIVPIAFTVILWRFPLLVSHKIIKPELDDKLNPLTVQAFVQVMVAGLGLYFLFYAMVDVIYYLTLFWLSNQPADPDAFMYMNSDTKANIVATAIELLVSAFILFKCRSISVWMMRIGR
ncbi:hypothetical protein A3759_09005 [Thalassolituus sp. HI0120]|nr:hypothetical protein A3759_09005 [Thalassolituus sp. HI0120]